MSNNLPVSSQEELLTYVERQKQNGWEDLPSKKKAFAHELVANGYNHRLAAETTGFPKSRGIALLREPLISAYIEHLQTLQLTNNIITKDFINAQYLHLYEMATGLEPIHHVLPDGEEIMVRKTELGTAHNILDKMSKSTDYAKETGNKSAAVNVNIDFGGLFGDGGSGGPHLADNVVIDMDVDDE